MNENAQEIARTIDGIYHLFESMAVSSQYEMKSRLEHFVAWDWTHTVVPHNGKYETANYRQLLDDIDTVEDIGSDVSDRLTQAFPKIPFRFKIDMMWQFRKGHTWSITFQFTEGTLKKTYEKTICYNTLGRVNLTSLSKDWTEV